MPTYEYRCPNGHAFEKFSPRITARRHVRCPTCGKMAERVISGGAGLVFKGSGFYVTDYKRAGEKAPEGETKPAETKAPESSKPSGSSDKSSKPSGSSDK
jgi:putative FmdB family regulatory protein